MFKDLKYMICRQSHRFSYNLGIIALESMWLPIQIIRKYIFLFGMDSMSEWIVLGVCVDMCVHMLAYITVWTVCMCAYSSHVLMQVYLVLIIMLELLENSIAFLTMPRRMFLQLTSWFFNWPLGSISQTAWVWSLVLGVYGQLIWDFICCNPSHTVMLIIPVMHAVMD